MAVLKLADQVDLLAAVSLARKQAAHHLTLHSTDSMVEMYFLISLCCCILPVRFV